MTRLFTYLALLLPVLLSAQEKSYSAPELIAAMKAARPSGGLYARLRLEHQAPGAKPVILQVQLKRRTVQGGGSEALYQVLFPKERKGESLLLRVNGETFSGITYTPVQPKRALKPAERASGIFGTALTLDDAIAGFLQWENHQITGREKVGNAQCTIVESKPAGGTSGAGVNRVRSWIDEARLTAMRVELFSGGDQPIRSVMTHKVLKGKSGYYAPVSLTVTDHKSGASTKVEGVRADSDLVFTDADFSEAALESLTVPPSP